MAFSKLPERGVFCFTYLVYNLLVAMHEAEFIQTIWKYYRAHGRHDILWRTPAHTGNPYRILVSEVMLQQTQVSRVAEKYRLFIGQFPTFNALADASTTDVLRAWQGLGYNRRALNLKRAAEVIVTQHGGKLPSDPALLYGLPGIGEATAGSIAAFAFNVSIPFIETNIRRVFIHFFFPRSRKVSDERIMKLVRATLDKKNPREWYYALMDYGAMLGVQQKENANTRSKKYRKQPMFKGSRRALRGAIVRLLLTQGPLSEEDIVVRMKESSEKIHEVLVQLRDEKFIVLHDKRYKIA